MHAAGLGSDPAPAGLAGDLPEVRRKCAQGVSPADAATDVWGGKPDLGLMFAVHGFGDLATYASGRRSPAQDCSWQRVIESWLRAEIQPATPAWHPYPTSVRLIAWSSALGEGSWPESFRGRIAGEISRQARYLRRAIEYDIGGNHVLKNAVALVFAGVVVPASGVYDRGLGLLERELARQMLADGAHEERSSSYHREITRDLAAVAELLRRARVTTPPWLEEAHVRAQAWQRAVAGPGGTLPMLNDSWEGPPLEGSTRPRPAAVARADSGYVVFTQGDDQAVFDCGPLCPDHLPAHAHADALSFVLWLAGRAVVVDPGTYAYRGPWRNAFRRTAAHSTIEVDGQDQCVFWGNHRASFLPNVARPRTRELDGIVVVESSHDGYRRLPDPVVHHRALVWIAGTGIVIVDRLECRTQHRVRSTLPLAPGLDPVGGQIDDLSIQPLSQGGVVSVEDSWYSARFGEKTRARSLVEYRVSSADELFGWTLLRRNASASIAGGELELSLWERSDPVRVPLASAGALIHPFADS